ncbi:MAG: hypothetical protein COT24_02715 [Candidatus Kerfeldbacteria bacterium CG08_land_8_20_14_0_20_40_16]|uniref:Uncharacterized protein n=1 Tax=Candidatus Kerfeldbacteria bacterium CG08_land_8_20_14_0_20_40_16 TaxID=2014244 RepID=A0A2H0YVR8_9BACT|nr:MAG: hypothetical protein COT24_02715 [Candidatus Kerfeldbacteria bacterium CG08_land_8_20_14_0_20_40_16]
MKKFLILLVIFLFLPLVTKANIAPVSVPGQGIVPVDADYGSMSTTDTVTMKSETVLINIRLLDKRIVNSEENSDAYTSSAAAANVKATFNLENITDNEIKDFPVGFPFSTGGVVNNHNMLITNGWARLQNLAVEVDGQKINYEEKEFLVPNYPPLTDYTEPWAVWKMDFAKKGDGGSKKQITLSYDIISSDWYHTEFYGASEPDKDYFSGSFYYILHTGQGWQGNIGSSRIKFFFPKEIKMDIEKFDVNGVEAYSLQALPDNYSIDKTDHAIEWDFTNWKPAPAYKNNSFSGDIWVNFMYPDTLAYCEKTFSYVNVNHAGNVNLNSSPQAVATDAVKNGYSVFAYLLPILAFIILIGLLKMRRKINTTKKTGKYSTK